MADYQMRMHSAAARHIESPARIGVPRGAKHLVIARDPRRLIACLTVDE
jgi:hypothetical protein